MSDTKRRPTSGLLGWSVRAILLTTAAGGALFAAQPVLAQSAGAAAKSDTALEEVVVTSRRREERLQDVPLSVTAFTAEALNSLNLKDTAGLAKFSPGIQFSDVNSGRQDRGSSRQLIFRGLNLANNSGVTAGALIFLDGAPVIGGEIAVDQDIARVEVLRGPQNVYFGRSTFSGAVNYVTKPISNQISGVAEAEVATYNTYDVQGSIEGPLIQDKLFARVTARKASNDGQYTNQFNPSEKLGARSTNSVSGTLYAVPTDWFNAKLYANYYTNDDGISAAAFIPRRVLNCAANPAQPTVVNYYCGTLPDAGHIQIWQNTQFPQSYANALFHPVGGADLNDGNFDEELGFQRKALASHLIMNATAPFGITVQSITAYHVDHQTADADNLSQDISLLAAPNFRVFTFGFNQKYTDFSQEIRFTSGQKQRLRWTAGANYIKGVRLQQIPIISQSGTAAAPSTSPSFISKSQTKTVGAFAGVYLDILSPLTLSLEGRYQEDDRLEGGATNPSVFLSHTFKSFSPRVSLDYKINPNLTVYGSYAEGTRPGGFNAALLGQPASVLAQIQSKTGLSNTSYDEEKLNTYEVGLKGSLFDHRVRGALSAYYGTLSGQQVSTSVTYITPANAPLTVTLVSNTGRVRIEGVESEAAWRVFSDLTLSGTFSWTKTEVLSYPCTTCVPFIGTQNVNGNQLPISPEFSGSFAADYTRPLFSTDWRVFAHGDYVYRESMYVDYENRIQTGDINLVNFRTGVEKDNLRIEGYVTNAFGNEALTAADRNVDNAGGAIGFKVGLPEKRKFGLRVRYSFEAPPAAVEAPPPPPPPAPPPPPPPPPPPAPVAYEAREFIVYFPFDQFVLTPEAQTVVAQAADYAKTGNATKIVVVGHTDTSGSAAYNVRLSEKRAKTTADALVAAGVAQTTLSVDWKGESAPAVATADGVKEPLNRRATIGINF